MKTFFKRAVSAVLSAAAVFTCLSVSAFAADSITLSATTTATEVKGGETFDVDFVISDNDANKGFNNYTLFVNYNPAVVVPVSAADGDIKLNVGGVDYYASNADIINSQISYVPAAGNTDFPTADGTLSCAQLGSIKIAYYIDPNVNVDNNLQSYTDNGKLFTMTFKGVATGESDISVSVVGDNFEAVSNDAAIAKVTPVTTVASSKVSVSGSAILLGDANGDGIVNRADYVLLSKYFSGQNVTINEGNSDVDQNGTLNRADYVMCSKYFAGAISSFGK